MNSVPCVFLDRDGVLIEAVVRSGKPYPPPAVASMRIVPAAAEDLARLREAGFLTVVVTNQPDVARGTQTAEAVEEMHRVLAAALPLDAIYTCCHDDVDRCDCRKPQPGSLLRAAANFGIDLSRSYMIGDRWRDIEAGQRAGCRTILIDFGYDERIEIEPDIRVHTLTEAVDAVLSRR